MTKVNIYFTRHGYSKANCYAQHMGWLRHMYQKHFDVDPPLTKKGIEDIKVYREKLQFLPQIDILCASTMLRAIQTAQHLIPKKKIHVVPYVKEEGSDAECTPSSIAKQSHYFDFTEFTRVDYDYVRGKTVDRFAPHGYEGDYTKFLQWMEHHVEDLMRAENIPTNTMEVNILLVTHSVYMERFLCSAKKCDRPYNVGVVKKIYTFEDGIIDPHKFPMVTRFRMTDDEIHTAGPCESVVARGIPPPKWEDLV